MKSTRVYEKFSQSERTSAIASAKRRSKRPSSNQTMQDLEEEINSLERKARASIHTNLETLCEDLRAAFEVEVCV